MNVPGDTSDAAVWTLAPGRVELSHDRRDLLAERGHRGRRNG